VRLDLHFIAELDLLDFALVFVTSGRYLYGYFARPEAGDRRREQRS
jgi:hypothetical protein